MAPGRHTGPTLEIELALCRQGSWPAAGLDEVGRGAWAGPVVAAAVILPVPCAALQEKLHGVRDSKVLTAAQREFWAEEIRRTAVASGIGIVSSRQVDELGILPATRLAMQRSVEQLQPQPAHLVIDYVKLPQISLPQTSITRGDSLVLSIAAASILAKVTRDRMMVELDRQYPSYAFARNKGYGTREHQEALQQNGACPVHRFSYRPVAQLPFPGL